MNQWTEIALTSSPISYLRSYNGNPVFDATSSIRACIVDLGLNRPAVTSARQFLGEKRWKEQERRTFAASAAIN
ncbi:MAG TPA: hypothetical protein VKB35_06175 [Ktedonobacteraceae bacterium]|nr:hypothetical protein [Ktedonobacteraceae bacterium]